MRKVKYSKLKSFIHFITKKKMANSGLIIIFGSRGSGKSTDIAKDELNWELKKKDFKEYTDFYTNVEINTKNPNFHHLDLVNYKLTDYVPINEKTKNGQCYTVPTVETPFKIKENSIIELDELGIIAHSRDFKNFPKEFIHLIKYLRKLGILLIANSQAYDIDKTLREGASDLRLKRKLGWFSFSRKIDKKIVCSQINENNNGMVSAESQIHDELKFTPIIFPGSLKLTFIPFYTDRFDSYK